MFSVKMTLVEAITQYPSLFPNKAEVLDQLFLTIGNGYRWENGCVVKDAEAPIDPDNYSIAYFINKGLEKNKKFCDDYVFKGYKKELFDFYIKNVFGIMKLGVLQCGPINFYGLSKYALITKIPDNVRPDWLDAARVFMMLYRSRYNERGRCSDSYVADQKNYITKIDLRIKHLEKTIYKVD